MAEETIEQPPKKLSVDEFAAKIKAKYPDYAHIDNTTLTQKIISKYPEYGQQVDLTPQKKSFDFTHGYQPTPQDIQQKQDLTNFQNGLEQSPNGSNPSQSSPQNSQDWKNLFDQHVLKQIGDINKKHQQDLEDPGSQYYQDLAAKEAKEQAEYDKIPLSAKVKSVSNNVVSGVGDILKGSVRQANVIAKGLTPNTIATPQSWDKSYDDIAKVIDKGVQATTFPIDKKEQTILNSHGIVGALNGFANFVPALASAERTGGASIFFNDYEKGYQNIDKLDKENKLNLSEGQKQVYANMNGLTSALLMSHNLHSLLGNVTDKAEQSIINEISQKAIGDLAKSGEDFNHETAKNAINVQLNNVESRVKNFGIKALKGIGTSTADMAALEATKVGTEKLINTTTGKHVFNQDDMADRMHSAIENGLGIGVLGSILSAPQLLHKGEQRNSVIDGIYKNPSDENVNNIKDALTAHLTEQGHSPENIEQAHNIVDQIHDVAKSLPKGLSHEKQNKITELILQRKGLEKDLSDNKDQTKNLDPAFSQNAGQDDLVTQHRIDGLNDQIKSIATDTPLKYFKDEDGNTFKQFGDSEPEKIDENRYLTEKPSRTIAPNENIPNKEQATQQPADEGGQAEKAVNPNDETIKNNPQITTNQNQDESTSEKGSEEKEKSSSESKGGSEESLATDKEVVNSGSDKTEPETIISRNNDAIDKDREKRGLPPVFSEQEKSNPKTWGEAMGEIEKNPNAADDLIARFKNKPFAPDDVENAILLHKRISLENEKDRLYQKVIDANKNGEDPATYDNQLNENAQQLDELDKIDRQSGTMSGRSLQSRKLAAKNDFSFARLELQKRASLGRDLTPEERADLHKIHTEYQEKEKAYEAKIAELEERNRKLIEDTELRKLKQEAKKESKNQKQAIRTKNRQDLVQDIRNKLKASRKSNTAMSDIPFRKQLEELIAISPELAKLAKSYIAEGIDKLDDLVDKIHDDLKDAFEGLEKRAVRDAISGYGQTMKMSQKELDVKLRELKAQARSISALEDAKGGDRPLKTGLQRDKVSDKVRELQAQVREAMKQMGVSVKTNEEHLKSSLGAVKTRLKNQIKDLTKQIETGIKPPDKTQIQYDKEALDLKKQRDDIKAQLEDFDKPGMSDAQKLKNAIKATERSLSDYQRRIKEKDFTSQSKKKSGPDEKSLFELKAERDRIKKEFEDLKDAENPKSTPEQRALKALKTRTANQIADYEQRVKDLKNGTYKAPEPRTPIELDPEAIKAKAEFNRVKEDFNAELEKDRLANRGKFQKGWDKFLKYRRAELLLNLSGAAKVGMASAYRIVGAPMHEIAGSVVKQVPGIKQIAEKAPREGSGFVSDIEWKALNTVWSADTLEEVKKKFKGLLDNLDLAFGKDKHEHFDADRLLDLAGNIHSAEKEFAKQNEFRRSVLLRTKYAEEHGVDTSSAFVQLAIGEKALEDANRQIFMADNLANKGYKQFLGFLESKSIEGKFGKTGKITAGALRVLLPIVRVTTNFALEKFQYTPVIGATRAAFIVARGLKNMKPEEADYVMRIMKKQSLGAGLMMIGYFNPQAFGGFHVPGKKQKEGDLAANDVKLFGVEIPHFLTHTPLLTILQLGATIRRSADSYGDIALGTASDMAETTPFYDTPKDVIHAMESSTNMSQFTGSFIRGLLVPNLISQEAAREDKDSEGNSIKRSPKNVLQGIEMGLPGLRENVPIKNPHPKFDTITLGDKTYKLNNDQIQEREKFYDDYLKTDAAKRLKIAILKLGDSAHDKIKKKSLDRELKTRASKISKQKILYKYHNSSNGGYNLEKAENVN